LKASAVEQDMDKREEVWSDMVEEEEERDITTDLYNKERPV